MSYSEKLSSLTEWYRQLLAESTGKNKKGITPVLATGARDQHSQIQLYNDGPDDKIIIFLETKKYEAKLAEFSKLIKIEKKATEKSLKKNKRKTLSIEIDKITEESIGELIMFFELSIAFLAELMKINAFNQPGVELTKKYIKELL